MAQTASNRSTPFPPPPGLERTVGQNGHSNATQVAAGAGQGETVDSLCQSLLRDIDVKVNEKMEELWQKGRHMMAQAQQHHQQHNDALSAELSMCLDKQHVLEQQNDQIKQIIADLASKLSVLGSGFAGPCVSSPGSGCLKSPVSTMAGSSTASATPPSTRASFSDNLFGNLLGSSESLGALPEVPAFPFPAQTSPAPLSLAEAIGVEPAVKPTPLCLATSLPPNPTIELSPTAASFTPNSGVFSFTLRKADSIELGLNVMCQGAVLLVEGVRPEGAVDAWNRQCVGGAFPKRAVMIGDRIISVNNISQDPEQMLAECKTKQLLKFTIVRGNYPIPDVTAAAATSVKLTALRADASEFVPCFAGASDKA